MHTFWTIVAGTFEALKQSTDSSERDLFLRDVVFSVLEAIFINSSDGFEVFHGLVLIDCAPDTFNILSL